MKYCFFLVFFVSIIPTVICHNSSEYTHRTPFIRYSNKFPTILPWPKESNQSNILYKLDKTQYVVRLGSSLTDIYTMNFLVMKLKLSSKPSIICHYAETGIMFLCQDILWWVFNFFRLWRGRRKWKIKILSSRKQCYLIIKFICFSCPHIQGGNVETCEQLKELRFR